MGKEGKDMFVKVDELADGKLQGRNGLQNVVPLSIFNIAHKITDIFNLMRK